MYLDIPVSLPHNLKPGACLGSKLDSSGTYVGTKINNANI